jgi:hypothetical protein
MPRSIIDESIYSLPLPPSWRSGGVYDVRRGDVPRCHDVPNFIQICSAIQKVDKWGMQDTAW